MSPAKRNTEASSIAALLRVGNNSQSETVQCVEVMMLVPKPIFALVICALIGASSSPSIAQPAYRGGSQGNWTADCLDISPRLIDLKEVYLNGSDPDGSGWYTWVQAADPPGESGRSCGGQWIRGRHRNALIQAMRELRTVNCSSMDLYTSSSGWLIRGRK
jgi:hypothetical protein